MITLKNLETFIWVVRLGGFGHAAKRLNTTQSSVSQRIALLEGTLGTPLLERLPRQVILTPKGRELLPYAEHMVRLRSDILHVIGVPNSLTGHVRLGVAETIAHAFLVELVQKVQSTYPSVVLDIEVDISRNLRDALLRGDLDIIIPSTPVLEADVRNIDLVSYPMAWVASPTLPLTAEPISLKDIARFPIITYPKNTRPYQELRDLFLKANITNFKLYGNSSLSAITRLCAGGIGIAAIPTKIITQELANNTLRILNVQDAVLPALRFSVSYVLTPDAHLLEAIAQLSLDVLSATT